MRDNIAIVHHNPAIFSRSLVGKGHLPIIRFHILTDKFDQGAQVALIAAGADDKKIGDDIVGPQVQQEDVLGLAVFDKVNNMMCKF